MSTTIPSANFDRIESIGFENQFRIRLGRTASEMRARFDDFVALNPELVVEQDPSGEIVIMTPAGAEGSSANSEIARQLGNWSVEHGGRTFDSSAMFILRNGAKRSPDAAWIQTKRWDELPLEARKKYPEIAPDFVIELRSESDRLSTLQAKMQDYVDNGVKLAWLIDPFQKRVHIYRLDEPATVLDQPTSVSAGDVLSGFVLDLGRIL